MIHVGLGPDGMPTRKVVNRTYAAKYLLHHLIAEHTGSHAQIRNTILRYHTTQPETLTVGDCSGYTPLHIAAKSLKLPAVLALLSIKVSSPSEREPSPILLFDHLQRRDNAVGSTPLELCEEKLLNDCEWFESFFQDDDAAKWPGYNEDGLRVAYALRRVMGGDVGGMQNEDEYVMLKRWGCTCGSCAGGWLSERMRFQFRGKQYSEFLRLYHTRLQRHQRLRTRHMMSSRQSIIGQTSAILIQPNTIGNWA